MSNPQRRREPVTCVTGLQEMFMLSFDSMIRGHLAQANRYIAEMRADIARERVIVEHALDAGYPSEVAESMLHTLEGALRIFEKHRELVLNQLKRRPSE